MNNFSYFITTSFIPSINDYHSSWNLHFVYQMQPKFIQCKFEYSYSKINSLDQVINQESIPYKTTIKFCNSFIKSIILMNIMKEITITNRLPMSDISITVMHIASMTFFGIQIQINEHVTSLLESISHLLIMSLNHRLEGPNPTITVKWGDCFCHCLLLYQDANELHINECRMKAWNRLDLVLA